MAGPTGYWPHRVLLAVVGLAGAADLSDSTVEIHGDGAGVDDLNRTVFGSRDRTFYWQLSHWVLSAGSMGTS